MEREIMKMNASQRRVIMMGLIAIGIVYVTYAVRTIQSVVPEYHDGNSLVPLTSHERVSNPPLLMPITIILTVTAGLLITLQDQKRRLNHIQLSIMWMTVGIIVTLCLFPTMKIHLYYAEMGRRVVRSFFVYKPIFQSSARFFEDTGIGTLRGLLGAEISLSFNWARFLLPIVGLTLANALLSICIHIKRQRQFPEKTRNLAL